MISAALYSSSSGEWSTPQPFFDALDREFKFELDAAATADNAKCPRFYTPLENGLARPWAPYRTFVNPPYGRGMGAWMAKAKREALRGAIVVCLVPSRTDTAWFHEHVLGHAEIRFLRGRLRFGASENSAPFPSMLCIYRGFGPLAVVK